MLVVATFLISISVITMFSGVDQVDLPSPAIVGLLDELLNADRYQFVGGGWLMGSTIFLYEPPADKNWLEIV